MRFTTNAEASKGMNGDGYGGESTAILIDKALEHQNALGRTNKEMDNLLDQGRKMLDVASVLGLSNTVMRHIEKRTEGDKWILFGGMFLTCCIMFFVIRWFT